MVCSSAKPRPKACLSAQLDGISDRVAKALGKDKPRKGPRLISKEAAKVLPDKDALEAEFQRSRTLRILAIVALIIVIAWFLLALFEPGLKYEFSASTAYPIDSKEFLSELEALSDARVAWHSTVQPLPNGEVFYPAEIEAINGARRSVDIEGYIFKRGDVARQFVNALTDRARAGVRVNVVIDAIGSLTTPKHFFRDLIDAGGHVEWYHPLRWNNIFRSNNRTHRELIVVDGKTAFVGGAGIADHWLITKKNAPRWRDNMYRIQGDSVSALQGTFVENWVEASGEIIAGPDYFPLSIGQGSTPALVVNSSPGAGGSTRARMLFQSLVVASKKTIYITTPYFLPDRAMKRELLKARKRGVDVRILVPGAKSDHAMTRSSSRSKFGDLLLAGAHIYEYQPAMIHAKLLIVDGAWVVVGSTNFDTRSFGINDEVNLAAMDPALAQRMTEMYTEDLAQSHEVTYDEWKRRPPWERVQEVFGWLLERQQ